jgi:hypothetical protein
LYILLYWLKNSHEIAFSDRPLELPLFEIFPSKSQVVFEGDKLPFECRASVIDKRADWLAWNQDNVSEWGDMSIRRLLF